MAVQVAGSINVDLILSVDALPRAGETVLARESVRLPGGKGANQAVAAARMGAAAQMFGAVGNDEGGRWMRGLLDDEGIDTSAIATIGDLPTGLATIAVDRSGENLIVVSPGANAALAPAHLESGATGPRVRLAQLEIPVPTVRAFLSSAGSDGCIGILNAAPAVADAAGLFPLCDILVLNQHELAFYLGLDNAPTRPEHALVASGLISREGQTVIVTLGAAGAMAVRKDGHIYAPALFVTPLDTIGAGDCFCGALAALLDAGETLEAALPLANAAAALCTQKAGAIPAMPTRAEVTARMQAAPAGKRPR